MQPLTSPQIMALANRVVGNGETNLLCLSLDGRVRYANPSACDALGYAFEDLVKKSIADYTHDWKETTWSTHCRRTIANGADQIYSQHRNCSGTCYPVMVYSVPHIIHETNEQLICSLVQSVEQSKRYIRMLSTVESSYCIGSFDLDLTNDSMVTSQNLMAMIGVKDEQQLRPEAMADRLGKEDANRWQNHLEHCHRGFYRMDENFLVRAASNRHLLMRVVMWSRLERGAVVGITGHYEILEASGKESMISLEDSQRRHIIRALRYTNGRVTGPNGAGKLLKINGKTLFARMKKLDINREDYTQR